MIYAKRVLASDSYNAKALYRLANSLMKLGENREAYETLKMCIEAFK
jgi:hypothetical protein